MKKFWLIFTCTLMCAIPANAWLGRAVIIAFDKQTQNYRMLFAKINKQDAAWTDFHETGAGKGGEKAAKKAIETQLGGAYKDTDLTTIVWQRDKFGDVFHIFLAGKFIPGSILYPKMVGIGDVKWSTSLTDFTGIEQSPDILFFIKWALNQPELKKYIEKKPSKKSSSSSSSSSSKKSSSKTATTDFKDALKNGLWPKPGTTDTIHFYDIKDDFYEFTNTYNCGPVTIDGESWASTEHYFQSQKFINPSNAYNKYLKKETPGSLQKKMSDLLTKHSDEDKYKTDPTLWHGDETKSPPTMGVKHMAMLKALIAKFTQYKNLKTILLNTGDKLIIENAGYRDKEWGAGGDYKGRNILGQMLMWLRKELRDGKKANEIDPTKFVRVINPQDYLAVYEELTGKTVPSEKKPEKKTGEEKQIEEKKEEPSAAFLAVQEEIKNLNIKSYDFNGLLDKWNELERTLTIKSEKEFLSAAVQNKVSEMEDILIELINTNTTENDINFIETEVITNDKTGWGFPRIEKAIKQRRAFLSEQLFADFARTLDMV
ncbi:MAG: GTP cyclohydrolase-2 [candidate division TM6 bacterium GW2011_GWE2_42_60]|nr:MAG: GTP cyclohydrolase-2 [candidate division TM6 bacterium GW2011_GWE2_42_60]HBY05718.1 hypothetical protein [Candidatus Dependentiae bacterium]